MRSSQAPVLAAFLAAAACTKGAPPGFSSGDSWTFPLVGPLENGVLLAPVTVAGKGPYLFTIDPDASVSSIDEQLAHDLDLYTTVGPHQLDENDVSRPTRLAEVPSLTLGNLTVKGRTVTVHAVGTYFVEGREVRGVIGRDVLADSLVFGFDRDAGMGFLATRAVFTPPAGAQRLPYRTEDMEHPDRPDSAYSGPATGPTGAVPRRMAAVTVNGQKLALHVDLGAVESQLRASKWTAAKLAPVPYKVQLVDEVGTVRDVDKAGVANQVTAGGVSAMGLTMVPYDDKRWIEQDVDGALGLDFFAPYVVWADWSGRAVYVMPRDGEADKTTLRLARWAAPELAACKQPACTTAHLVDPGAAPPPTTDAAMAEPTAPAPVTIVIERDQAVAQLVFEALLEAVDAGGQPTGMPRLIATFPRGSTRIEQRLAPTFAGAHFRVLDISPFVRPCPPAAATGCVYELSRH